MGSRQPWVIQEVHFPLWIFTLLSLALTSLRLTPRHFSFLWEKYVWECPECSSRGLQDGTQTLLISGRGRLYVMLESWCSWSTSLGILCKAWVSWVNGYREWMGIMGEGSTTDWGIKALWSTPWFFVSFCFIICRKGSPPFFGQQKTAVWTSNLFKL